MLKIEVIRIILFVCIGSIQIASNAQILNPSAFVETDFKASAGKIPPYYSVSNQHGVFSGKKNALLLHSGIIADIDTTENISLSYGVDASIRYDSKNEIWLQQAFVRTKVCFLIFQGGLVEEVFGNQDDKLSSGAYLFSENARPMPKIALFTNDYITMPFTNKLVEIKGYIAHGWFGEQDQYVKNAFLHQKYLYLRIGEKKFPLSVTLGIHHAAMWGGTSPVYGSLPAGWDAYKSVFLGRMKGEFGPDLEQQNVLGNHLASYSLDIDYSMRNHSLKFYWQTILEDKNGRVGLDWKNKGDGLWGITLNKVNDPTGLQRVTLEFFNSTSQSGDIYHSGNDNYFNNYMYRSGWTYHNMTIGTPIISSPDLRGRNPEIISEIDINLNNYLDNNCVRALTAGFLYTLNEEGHFSFRLTYSRNYGTIMVPFNKPRDQLYSDLQYNYPSKRYRNLQFTWQGTLDFGSYLGNNTGLMFKMRKSF